MEDYNETFGPVARMGRLRFMLALVNQYNLHIHQLDVKCAFLNGDLDEKIFIKAPEGVVHNGNQGCKLNKSLYGHKQAARCWFTKFHNALSHLGFEASKKNRCIYFRKGKTITDYIYLLLYVDDVFIISGDMEKIINIKKELGVKFNMKDMGEIKLFLGMRKSRDCNKLTFDQSSYIKNVLSKFKMVDCKPVDTKLETKLNYTALNSQVH